MTSLASILKSLPVYGQLPNTDRGQYSVTSGPILKEPKLPNIDKLRRAAKNYPCVLCGKSKRFTVAAHSNDVRVKGIGKKAPGWAIAYLCGDPGGCHDKVDGRAGKLTKATKRAMWLEAYWLTVQIWFLDGLVVVA